MQSMLALIGLVLAYSIYSYISKLRYNTAEAKRSGLPYIVAREPLTRPHNGTIADQLLTHWLGSMFAYFPTMANDTQVLAPHHQVFPQVMVGGMARVCPCPTSKYRPPWMSLTAISPC